MAVDREMVAIELCKLCMIRNLVDDDDPSEALEWNPLVDVAKRIEMLAQRGQDERMKEGFWERGDHYSVRFLGRRRRG